MPRFSGAHLAVENAVKTYGKAGALNDVSLTVERGEILALLGPSGCGKTTLLKIIAGLIEPDRGEVLVDGRSIVSLPTHKRDMGMLFQNYALFPHMDVLSNVAFGLEMRRLPKAEIHRRATDALNRVRLGAFAERMPRELSGGQQQRVALARAIAYEPTILLLDEPLAALDKNLREGMQMELRSLCRQLELTTVLVTHDQEEAMTMADRIAVMREGRLEQIGRGREVYGRPDNRFVASFIGTSNFLSFAPEGRSDGIAFGRTEEGLAIAATPGAGTDQECVVAVRPEHIALSASPLPEAANTVSGTLSQILFRGTHVTAVLTTEGGKDIIVSSTTASMPAGLAEGSLAWASWHSDHALLVKDN